MNRRISAFILITVMTAFLGGCSVGPDFMQPKAPESTPQLFQHGGLEKYMDRDHWWRDFGDQELNALVGRSVKAELGSQKRHRQGIGSTGFIWLRAIKTLSAAGFFCKRSKEANG